MARPVPTLTMPPLEALDLPPADQAQTYEAREKGTQHAA